MKLNRVVFLMVAFFSSSDLAAQAEEMQAVAVGGRRAAYHVMGGGRGTPLVLINGGPGFDHRFLHLSNSWALLAGLRRVVFFDQPGTGQSWPVGPSDSVAISDVLETIEGIRAALGVTRIAVLGHSWGGYVAMAYALRYPEHVDRLVLVSSVAPNIGSTEYLRGALFADVLSARATPWDSSNPEDVQAYIRQQLRMSFYSSEKRDAILRRTGRIEYNGHQESLLWRDAESRDLTSDLGNLAIPVLVGTGRFDGNIGPRNSWRIHQLIPRSQFHVWEQSGHFPMIEEPEAFFEIVNEFLRQGSRN